MHNNSIFHLLIKIFRNHHKKSHRFLKQIKLYRGQPRLLHLLWQKEGRTQKELCDKLKCKPSTIAKMVKRMENEGFITKKKDTKDRRLSRIYLTKKGKKIQRKVKQIENKIEKICLQGFTEEEKILLKKFLIKINDNLKE